MVAYRILFVKFIYHKTYVVLLDNIVVSRVEW